MKRLAMILATIGALSISSAAAAQVAPEMQLDPVKMKLARELMVANGGERQYSAQLKATFGALKLSISEALPVDQNPIIGPLYDDLDQEMSKLAPQMMDLSARLYAQTLTEKELTDMLAFRLSDSGRSIAAKMPAIQKQAVEATIPLIRTMMPTIIQKTLDRVCEEKHCTPEQRKTVANAMSGALPHPAS